MSTPEERSAGERLKSALDDLPDKLRAAMKEGLESFQPSTSDRATARNEMTDYIEACLYVLESGSADVIEIATGDLIAEASRLRTKVVELTTAAEAADDQKSEAKRKLEEAEASNRKLKTDNARLTDERDKAAGKYRRRSDQVVMVARAAKRIKAEKAEIQRRLDERDNEIRELREQLAEPAPEQGGSRQSIRNDEGDLATGHGPSPDGPSAEEWRDNLPRGTEAPPRNTRGWRARAKSNRQEGTS